VRVRPHSLEETLRAYEALYLQIREAAAAARAASAPPQAMPKPASKTSPRGGA
jgi:hypothetical protein